MSFKLKFLVFFGVWCLTFLGKGKTRSKAFPFLQFVSRFFLSVQLVSLGIGQSSPSRRARFSLGLDDFFLRKKKNNDTSSVVSPGSGRVFLGQVLSLLNSNPLFRQSSLFLLRCWVFIFLGHRHF